MEGQVFSQRRFFDRIKHSLSSLVILWMLVRKTGGTLLLTILVYSLFLGWRYALGLVLLIFVHEAGHLIAARMMGLQVSWPVFIPFMGAIIALKEAPRSAWVEAVVGIGGPILGTLGAVIVWHIYFVTGNVLFLALAYAGFLLNLFNLIPMVPLDGGRIVTAISPRFWILGLLILLPVLFLSRNIMLTIILWLLIMESLPRVVGLFRKPTDEEKRYYECTRMQRVVISTLYFSLLAGLGLLMYQTDPLMQYEIDKHGGNYSDILNGTHSR